MVLPVFSIYVMSPSWDIVYLSEEPVIRSQNVFALPCVALCSSKESKQAQYFQDWMTGIILKVN